MNTGYPLFLIFYLLFFISCFTGLYIEFHWNFGTLEPETLERRRHWNGEALERRGAADSPGTYLIQQPK